MAAATPRPSGHPKSMGHHRSPRSAASQRTEPAVQKLNVVTRHRHLLLPLGAVVVVGLGYALLAIGGASGRPPRPSSAAVQDPVTQAEPPALGTAIGAADTGGTDPRTPV